MYTQEILVSLPSKTAVGNTSAIRSSFLLETGDIFEASLVHILLSAMRV